jgi:hypothetical protein
MNDQHADRPTSWRDTYALVRDTREDVLAAVNRVNTKVDHLTQRVNAIEVARAAASGQSAGEARIAGIARSSIALVLSVISAATALIAVVGK